jgi:hypothetical protein
MDADGAHAKARLYLYPDFRSCHESLAHVAYLSPLIGHISPTRASANAERVARLRFLRSSRRLSSLGRATSPDTCPLIPHWTQVAPTSGPHRPSVMMSALATRMPPVAVARPLPGRAARGVSLHGRIPKNAFPHNCLPSRGIVGTVAVAGPRQHSCAAVSIAATTSTSGQRSLRAAATCRAISDADASAFAADAPPAKAKVTAEAVVRGMAGAYTRPLFSST